MRLKVREHRERLRAQGLRPIQIWVPDVRAAAFREQAHQQSQAVSASAQAHDDQAVIDALSDVGDLRAGPHEVGRADREVLARGGPTMISLHPRPMDS